MREFRAYEEELAYLGPVAIAIFVDIGWLSNWPLGWTKVGRRALSRGYGRWDGPRQLLPPGYAEMLQEPSAYWPGRRAKIPVGTSIPMVDERQPAA